MTFLEELRKQLQDKEAHYHDQIGARKGWITPPMLKYTLSDPNKTELNEDLIGRNNEGCYVCINEFGYSDLIEDPEWDVYEVTKLAIPLWLRQEEKNIYYQGYLEGEASVIMFDAENNVLGSFKATNEPITEAYFVAPKGTARMLVSRKRGVDVKVNFKITYQDFTEFDITEFVTNETDLEVSFQRDRVSGVYVDASLPIYLTLVAKDFVDSAFFKYGLKAKVQFNVYKRDDVKLNVYELVKTSPLNFSSFKSNKDTTELALVNSTLNELINSRGKNKYDIKVREVADPKKWNYERMTMFNRGNYEIPVGAIKNDHNHTYYHPYVYLASAEMTPGSAEHDMKTQSSGEFSQDKYFFKAEGEVKLSLNLDLVIRRDWVSGVSIDFQGEVVILKNGDKEVPIWRQSFIYKGLEQETETTTIQIYECVLPSKIDIEEPLQKGDTLSICIHNINMTGGGTNIYSFNEFSVFYNSKGITIEGVDVIKLEVYCQKLLDLVSETSKRFDCEFHWGDIDYKPMLCAAESIRALEYANIQGSLVDMLDWMQTLGYEYACDDHTLVFKPRDQFFDKNTTALELKSRENTNLEIQASDDLACATIEVGYEQQDYESVNGRFEINGTFEYSTGYSSAVKSTPLKLISPYRADPIGIELLFWERKNSTKDTKSDNDIFVVAMTEEDTHYRVYTDIVATVEEASELKMFNAVFNPVFLIKKNESLIGVNTDKIKFISTTSCRSGDIDVLGDLYGDIEITKQLFKPYQYNFVTGNHIPLPSTELRNGLVKFYNQGWKQGFIKRIFKNYSKESESTWILYAIE